MNKIIKNIIFVLIALSVLLFILLILAYLIPVFCCREYKPQISEWVYEQIRSELIVSDKRLIFPKTQIKIERGETTLLAWGLKNTEAFQLDYRAEFKFVECPGGPTNCLTDADLNKIWFGYDPTKPKRLQPTDYSIETIKLNVPKSATTGTYLIDFSIWDSTNNSKYASVNIFVTVT